MRKQMWQTHKDIKECSASMFNISNHYEKCQCRLLGWLLLNTKRGFTCWECREMVSSVCCPWECKADGALNYKIKWNFSPEYVHDNWMQNLKCTYTVTVVRKIAKNIATIKVFIDVHWNRWKQLACVMKCYLAFKEGNA